jgi:hypothetical protein
MPDDDLSAVRMVVGPAIMYLMNVRRVSRSRSCCIEAPLAIAALPCCSRDRDLDGAAFTTVRPYRSTSGSRRWPRSTAEYASHAWGGGEFDGSTMTTNLAKNMPSRG